MHTSFRTFPPEHVLQVNRTARHHGAVGPRALVPRLVPEIFPRQAHLLDYGSGPGAQHAQALRAQGWWVTAHEIGGNVRVGVHDPMALEQQYEGVYASNVLNVLPDAQWIRIALLEMTRCLASGGRLLANWPVSPNRSRLRLIDIQQIAQETGLDEVRWLTGRVLTGVKRNEKKESTG